MTPRRGSGLYTVERAVASCGARQSALGRCASRLRGLGVVLALGCCAAGFAAEQPAASGWSDMHVHTAGIGAGDSGIYVHPSLLGDWRFPFYLRAFGVDEAELRSTGDGLVVARISTGVAESTQVGRAVVLALDGAVDTEGKLDREATQLYVPNGFVAGEVARYDNLCFGASVNPYRDDALERLDRVFAQGALLVKWIPNIMHIDPADEAIVPFYEKLIALGLPLLSHAGQERSFASARDEFGDPRRLALPLKLGVTVIAAHVATTGSNEGEGNFERLLPMFDAYPNLYADISSLTQINKRGFLVRALAVPGLHRRLVYGTDWPLQFFPLVSSFYHLDAIGWAQARTVFAIANPWDRDIALKTALGAPTSVFARSSQMLAVERCAAGEET